MPTLRILHNSAGQDQVFRNLKAELLAQHGSKQKKKKNQASDTVKSIDGLTYFGVKVNKLDLI
jgi:hypothetical protein